MLTPVRVTCLFATALILGLSFAHVLELPGKLRLDGPAWLLVQHNLYVGFGAVAAIVEPLAILLAWALVWLSRTSRGRRWALLAALCASAGLFAWWLLVAPMNALLNGWTTETLPATWTACRDQWEAGHAIHAALFAAAFGALLASLVADTAVGGRLRGHGLNSGRR